MTVDFRSGLKAPVATLNRWGRARPYRLAFGFMAVALLVRCALQLLAPGIAYLVVLLPAVVVGGVFCGTLPAALAAAAGLVVIAVGFVGRQLVVWPPGAQLVDLLLFLPACVTILWATKVLRDTVASAGRARARLAEVFRQIPGAAAIIEAPDGRVLARSENSAEVLGHPVLNIETVAGLAQYGGIDSEGRPLPANAYPIARALRHGENVRAEPLRYRQPSGRVVDLEIYAGPVRGPDGVIIGAVGMAFDVTERTQAEHRLREREAAYRALSERLSTALDAGDLGAWEVCIGTRRTRWDARLAAMFGLPPEPIELSREAGRRFFDTPDIERVAAAFERAVAEGGRFAEEFRVLTVTGETRWLLMRGAVLRDSAVVIGVARDVTEQRQREDQLRETVRLRELLLREADHRIRNSLQLVGSLLTLQQARLADPDAIAALSGAIARVQAVADAHLALQQSEDLRTIEAAEMVRDICARLGPLNPSLALRCSAPHAVRLPADKAIPLGLIVSEVLTNALRHAYAPGIAGWVEVDVEASDGALLVRIADGGRGVPEGPGRRGLGTTVIGTLAGQIGAICTMGGGSGRGASVSIRLAVEDDPT